MGKGKRLAKGRKTHYVRAYSLSNKEIVIFLAESIGITIVVAWIFYDSIWGLLTFPLVAAVNFKRIITTMDKKRTNRINTEFKEMLLAVSAALQSGYSIENAFKDSENNLVMLYGKKSVILPDLREMNIRIGMRESAENAFGEFAKKYPTEEVVNFGEVFSFARRLGGDYVKNLRRTIEKMEDKLEIKQEISSAIAQKEMELKVMCFMPFMILSYIKLTSPDFIEAIYHNTMGIMVMTGCLIAYVFFLAIGKNIVNIEV